MANHWSNNGLLNQRRQEQFWQRLGPRAVMAAAALVAVVGAIAFWPSGETEPTPVQLAAMEVDTTVASAAVQAREQLKKEVEKIREKERQQYRAKHEDWEEGQSRMLKGSLKPGQSVYQAMVNRGIPEGSVWRIITASEEEIDFRRSRAGDQWQADVDTDGTVERLRYERSPERIWVTEYDEEQQEYVAAQREIELETQTRTVAGEVEGSFWLSISRQGESDLLAHRFMKVFEYTVDFNTESRDGDLFAMVVEEKYLDGEFLRYGRVLGAIYVGDRGPKYAYYFEPGDDEDEAGYFDRDGESLQRQFLRSPLEVTRVTSTFGRRQHPITGDHRMHNGVDYGAPTGTPVQATADGRVVFAGWSGGYGKLLKIEHRGGYQTRYAHLSSFGSGIRAGTRVSQGQIVARSGNTGASTAPHLHYEMLRHGRHINPLEVDSGSGEPLEEQYREEFQQQVVQRWTDELHAVLEQQAPGAMQALGE